LFEKTLDKLKTKKIEAKVKQEKDSILMNWKEKLNEAMTSHSSFRDNSNNWDRQYHDEDAGKDTTIYMSNKSKAEEELDSNVNITMQLIEGSIDITVPKPAVSAIESADGMENRKMIEGILTYMSEGAGLQRIVSENERITKKNGFSVMKIMFDPDYNGRTYKGRIETTNPHPVNFVPQPGIGHVEDMDYCFQIDNKTIDYVCRTYGEEFRKDLELESAEYIGLEDFGEEQKQKTDNMVSVIECWYRDEDGEIGLITWADDTILRDLPKFYYPRDKNGEIEDAEMVDIEVPREQPIQLDQQGNEVLTMQPQEPQSITVEVERKVPKRFPFVLWYNIPKEKSVYGISDCQIIKRQQESIKRMITKEERKQNKGTTKIFTRKGAGLVGKLKDAESQIIETDDPTGDVRVVDIKTPSNGIYELYGLQLQAAKDLVGVTEASQGRSDTSNMSGKALETLSANTAARLSIKTNEKYMAFRELYSLMYEFIIAYYDDKVPFRVEGAAEVEYGYFDKSKLLKQDIAGEYYYPEFDIYINADAGMAKDKNFMIQIADKAMATGAADAIDYWTIMDSINMPNASFILERARERLKMQQQAEQEAKDIATQDREIAQQDKATSKQDIEGQANAVIKENEGLKKQLSKNAPEENPQPQEDDISSIIAELDPEEQKMFFESSDEEKQAMLAEMQGGN